MGKVSITYTNEFIKDEQRAYLLTLSANVHNAAITKYQLATL